jgi:glycosyltransferase involved in cell wall biosynthesis
MKTDTPSLRSIRLKKDIYKALSPNVFLGYIGSSVFGIYTIEDKCLNNYYCSPNKMFEYLMAGLPVIVSNLYEMKKVVDDNGVGIVAQENTIEGLLRACQKATKLDHIRLYENIQKVKNIYNWEEQEKVLLKVYEELND